MSNKKIDKLVDDIYPDIDENNKKIPKAVPVETSYFTSYNVMGVKMTPEQDKQNKNVWIYIMAIVIFIIVFFIVWIIIYAYFIKEPEEDIDETKYSDLNIGAYLIPEQLYAYSGKSNKKTNMSVIVGSELNDCPTGMYGDNCQFYMHDPKFYIAGIFDSNYTYDYEGEKNLSFNGTEYDKESCTALCESDCYGVIYDSSDKTCSLITSNIEATGTAYLDFSNTKQMYLKRKNRPEFSDAVIGYSGKRFLRYYLNNGESFHTNNIVRFDLGNVINLSWCPLKISNYGGKTGYFSDTEFTNENYLEHEMLYIDNGNGEYSLPLNLQISNIYILYL